MTPEFYQWVSLAIGIIMIILVIGTLIYLVDYIELIKSDPCQVCRDNGFMCIKWEFGD